MSKKFIFVNAGTDYEESVGAFESAEHIAIRQVGAAAQNWARTGDVITITSAAHGILSGNTIEVTVTSDAAALPLGSYTATYIGVNDFSVIGLNAGAASGTTTYTAGTSKPIMTNTSGKVDLTFIPAGVTLADGTVPFTGEVQGVDPATATGLTTKQYVDARIISGGQVKEALLFDEQTDNAQGILAAAVTFMTAIPVANDTFVIKNASVTETYTFKASEAAPFDVAIGVDAATTMANLAAAIEADSAAWGAEFYANALDSINANGVVAIHELATAAGTSTSRFYGTWATQSDCKVVEYNGTLEYTTAKAPITLPATDPGAGRFGIRRQVSALINGEIHLLIANDVLDEWDADASTWWTLSAGVVPEATAAPGGGIKGKWTADTYKGLNIISGVGEVRVDASTINFIASGGNQGKLEVPDNGITAAEINSSAVGSGLTGGSGSAIAIDWAVSPWNTNKAVKDSDLSAVTTGKGASIVGVEDSADYYVGTNVETVLAEIGAKIAVQGSSYTVGAGGVTKAQLVYVSSNNTVLPLPITGAGSGNWGIGLAATTQSAAALVQVTEKSGAVLTSVLTSATAGTRYYWNGSGLSTTPSSSSGGYVWLVGVAKNATDLTVDIQFIKKNA